MEKTTNYQNGKIYKVMNSSFDMCYIGSTIDKLSNRMNSHRSKYRKYKEGEGGFTTIYNMFDKYGENNCKIYLIENYPCQTKDELFAREGHYQKIMIVLIKIFPDEVIKNTGKIIRSNLMKNTKNGQTIIKNICNNTRENTI